MMTNNKTYAGMSREELKNELADIDLELSERELLDLIENFVSVTDSGDEDRVLPFAEKLAEQVGNADAAEVAGEIHFKRKHIPEAAGFFKLGAARGNTRAMLFMAEFYNWGQIPCEDPKKEYYYWVKKASGLGDVQASYQLATVTETALALSETGKNIELFSRRRLMADALMQSKSLRSS